MRSAIAKIERAGIALALSAVALLALGATTAQGISTQTSAAGLSIGSAAEPTFFSPARNATCEASPTVTNCDSFTITVRNEGGQQTGVAKVGEKQTCDPGVWDAANPPSEFKYEWLRELFGFSTPRVVGTAQSYTPQKVSESDEGFTLTCRVTATNAFGSAVAHSQPLRVAPLPKATSGVIQGFPSTLGGSGAGFNSPRVLVNGSEIEVATVNVGEGLVCDPGTWAVVGSDPGEGVRLRYRWLVNGAPQSSSFTNAASFKVPVAAGGKAVQCEVAATLVDEGVVVSNTYVFAASKNRVVANPVPVGGEAPKLSGNELTLVNTPTISGITLTIKNLTPPGVTAVGVKGSLFRSVIDGPTNELAGQLLPCTLATATCQLRVPLEPGEGVTMFVFVTVQQNEGEIGGNVAEVFDGNELHVLQRGTVEEPFGKILPSLIGKGDPPFAVRSASLQPFGAAGLPATQAGDRPGTITTGIQFPTAVVGSDGANSPPKSANVRDIRITLPPGLIGNPLVSLRCPESKAGEGACPASAQVGAFRFTQRGGVRVGDENLAIFNTIPTGGYPAEFGGIYLGRFVGIYANLVRASASQGGYTVQVTVPGVPILTTTNNTLTTFYGDPAGRVSEVGGGPAFLTNPSNCGTSPEATIEADSWQEIGEYRSRTVPLLPEGKTIENCSLLTFGPSISMQPDTNQADTPAGFGFELNVPQAPDTYPTLGTPPLKDATVTLPEGLAASPAQADGLVACTAAQIDIEGEAINGFGHDDEQPHPTPGNCPLASKIATAKVTTPLLPTPVEGSVFLGAPDCSPCTDADAQAGKLIKLYIEARDKKDGIVVKLPGEVKADPATGQLTATFLNGPQFPFSKVEIDFKGGPRAALSTPLACGTYTTTSDFTPWSAPETPNATPASAFEVTSGPNGSACVASEAQAPNAPSFEAGVLNPLAGNYSPFVLRMSRTDGSQRIKGLNLTLPPGLSGKLAGIPACSDASLAAAEAHSGKAEQQSPSCPAASEVGTVTVGAGAGPNPLYTQGHAYLSAPYKNAPLSLAIVTPAVAGPFDLGTVVVKTALYVDPTTAQITAKSDPFPTILAGVPLNVRSVAVKMDRQNFVLNPTSCEAMQISGEAISVPGQVAQLTNRFQVGGCEGLPFKPRLGLRLFGGTKRGSHPKLRAILTAKPGEANIASASIALPRSEFLDQGHIRTVCTRVQFAANECPAASIYGHVSATTPLLDEPLSGPIYLRSSSHKLPDVVGVLKGPETRPIQIEGVARIDSIRGGIRANLETIPDAPITKVVISMQGGKKGLLINSRNLCKSTNRATVKMDAQNGKVHDFRPVLRNDCARQRKR